MIHALSRRSALTGALALAALPARADEAFAPPPANGKSVQLRFATNTVATTPAGRVLHDILAKFHADYPHVTVAVEESPGDAQMTRIKLDAGSDRLPDFFSYWRLDPGFGLDQVARAGQLADLTAWTQADPFFKGLFDDYSWRTASLDGKVYGIPSSMYFLQFLANKSVFDRAGVAVPADWDGLLAAVKALKAKGEIPWAISIGSDSEGGRLYNYVVNRMVGNPRALRMHAGAEPIDVPEMVTAATHLHDLVVGYVPQDAISINNDSVYAKYVNTNRGAYIIDGSWVTQVIKPEIQDHLAVLSFPLIPGGVETTKGAERDLTSLYYVSAKSFADADRRPYVQEIIRRLSSRDAAKRFAEEGKLPMAQLGVQIDPAKYGRLATEALALSLVSPAYKWIPTVMTPTRRGKFEPLLSEFLNGKHDPKEFVAQLGVIFST